MSIQRLGTPAYKIFFLKSNKLCRHLSLGPNFKISLLNSSFQDRWHVIYIWECSLAASLPCNLLGSIPLGVDFVLSGLASTQALRPRFCLTALEKNWKVSPKLRDKIRNGEPGFKATSFRSHSQASRHFKMQVWKYDYPWLE